MPLDLALAECETRHGELLVYHVIITVGHTASRGHIETILEAFCSGLVGPWNTFSRVQHYCRVRLLNNEQ